LEFGGDGGSKLAGCCTFATMMDGELRSNCWIVQFGPIVNRLAPGPQRARPLTCSKVGMLSDVTCLVLTSQECVCLDLSVSTLRVSESMQLSARQETWQKREKGATGKVRGKASATVIEKGSEQERVG
jgi:hypothetical protein